MSDQAAAGLQIKFMAESASPGYLEASVRSHAGLVWSAAAVALAIVLAVPFFLVDVPPVLDYPNHLARYFILAHPDDPALSQMFEPHWAILPNLGMDVIATGLLKLLPVHVGGRLCLALSLFAPVIGAVIYSRVVFGRFTYWSLASGLIAYNGVFFLGFMNFLLSLGLALAAAAGWIALRQRSGWWPAALAGAASVTVIFFCHLFGVMLFALLIGSSEAARLWDARRPSWGELLRVGLLVGLVLSPAVALYLASPLADGPAYIGSWQGLPKLWAALTPFMTYSKYLTLLTSVVVYSFLVLNRRTTVVAPAARLAFVVLALVFVLQPAEIKGGSFLDVRIALMIGLLAFAAVQPRLALRPGLLAGALFAALIVLRSSYVSAAWIEHRTDVADLRSAIATVEPLARVLVMRGHAQYMTETAERPGQVLPGIYRLDGHLGSLLTIERGAFLPLLFASPSQQPLALKPPYRQIAQPLAEPVEWSVLRQETFSRLTLAYASYLRNWRSNYDYVLLIDPLPDRQPVRDLDLVAGRGSALLYRINKPGTGASLPR
ncbi:hypothetical protein [Rhodopseudomonas palustris]|uniref:Glycosyltransferase RgtA/B/C/D-like domain-containing protein n=1 Tax=Rhodopseudomonas palustris (strain BisB18) TaxID=316056 RepID=Q21B04_RHOPB